MPLWIGAYLADTQHLTRDEHGAYLLLLMAYWRAGAPLPDDDKRLSAIAKASPKEWKTLRPTMAEFFVVADGVWAHKRVDSELGISFERKVKAQKKAQKGAQVRWGNEPQATESSTNFDATSNAPSNASSMPQALLEDMPKQCPTPSPLPINTKELKHTLTMPQGCVSGVDENQNTADNTAESVVAMLARRGFPSVSVKNTGMLERLARGVTLAMFEEAAQIAFEKRKEFNFILGVLDNKIKDANGVNSGANSALSMPQKAWDFDRQSIEATALKYGVQAWVEPTSANGFIGEVYTAFVDRVRDAVEAKGEEVTA